MSSRALITTGNNFEVKGHGDWTLKKPPVPEWVAHRQLSEHKFGDITFTFDGGKVVYAHSMILYIRCQALFELYDKQVSKKKKKTKGITNLQIPQPYDNYPITPETFDRVLQFLYADNLQFETIDARATLDLCNAARTLNLARLIRLCHNQLRASISLENIHGLLKIAHDTNEERVKAFCIRFASENRKDFIGNKGGVAMIGVDLFQDVMAALLAEGDEDLADKNPPPASTLVNDFKKLHADVDVGAIHGDSMVSFKGVDVEFHKSFFAAHSKSLSASFQPIVGGEENTTEILKVKSVLTTIDSFRAVLRYLYYGDLSGLVVSIACEVQEFAKIHGMVELQHICEFIMAVNINADSVMSIMKVVFNQGNIKRPELDEIRRNTLTFFRQNIHKIDFDMVALLENGALVMAEIIMSWQMAKQAQDQGTTEEEIRSKRGADMVIPATDSEDHSRSSGLHPSESSHSLADDESMKEERPKPNKQNSILFGGSTDEDKKKKGSRKMKKSASKEAKKSKSK